MLRNFTNKILNKNINSINPLLNLRIKNNIMTQNQKFNIFTNQKNSNNFSNFSNSSNSQINQLNENNNIYSNKISKKYFLSKLIFRREKGEQKKKN